ncbi:1-aminocyclopropane-1-carboxylate oxidase homolog 4-like [Chenopodium quinoa]|uniref:1-aminocyclopropane-1-carboxylate oxidase homolog 4-like n=1 Tax=Chenopodium quinoa TaxID=63459 RepID=UPI000B76E586|nr:1-aminocyclopropane-1-carboxylate oxidase homolog 4-like [Chenopodium quinoa]
MTSLFPKLDHPLKVLTQLRPNTKTGTIMTSVNPGTQPVVLAFDRQDDVKKFENTKLGVKGLVDSGVTQIPSIFHHPPENLVDTGNSAPDTGSGADPIPVIDLSGPTPEVVDQVRKAAGTYGFFQVINHGVPVSLLDRLVKAVKAFHELPAEERMKHYRRDMTTGVNYFSNVDLFVSKAASWRDTLQLRLGPIMADVDSIPDICRNEILEWDKEVKQLTEKLLGLFSQGLGVKADKLVEMSCSGGKVMVGHYYPYCPEPNKTVGIACHTDPGVLTVLLQDQVGGLQIKHQGNWVNFKPVHGALVINVGDLLQILSNDKYTSVEHRVYANPQHEPRVSIAVFCNPSKRDDLYGPLPEIVSPEEPAHYRQFTYSEFINRFLKKELEGKTLAKYFSLEN